MEGGSAQVTCPPPWNQQQEEQPQTPPRTALRCVHATPHCPSYHTSRASCCHCRHSQRSRDPRCEKRLTMHSSLRRAAPPSDPSDPDSGTSRTRTNYTCDRLQGHPAQREQYPHSTRHASWGLPGLQVAAELEA